MIRYATYLDIPTICELGLMLHANFLNVYHVDEMLKDELTKILVYEIDGKVVAFLSATDLGQTCDILDIVVHPDYRRQKIASNLIAYLISELSNDLQLITLEVATTNESAIRLYQKFGFGIVNTRKHYYQDQDAYLMARESE